MKIGLRFIALLLIPALVSAECRIPMPTAKSVSSDRSCFTDQALSLRVLGSLSGLGQRTKTTLRGVLGRGQSPEEVDVDLFQHGILATNIGNSFQWYAEPLAIIDLVTQPQSGTQLGMNEFYSYLALVVLFAVGVVMAKRVRKRHVAATQIIRMIKPLLMAILMWSGYLQIGHILLLSGLAGIVNAYGLQAFQSFNNLLVKPENEDRTIGRTIRQSNLGRVIGFVIAVLINTHFGLAWYFIANALSFVVYNFFLWLMDGPRQPVPAPSSQTFIQESRADLREFLSRVRGIPRVTRVLALFGLSGVLGFPLVTLMPDLTSHVFYYSDASVGWLRGAFYGGGAIAGHAFFRIIQLAKVGQSALFQSLAEKIHEGKWVVILSMIMLGLMSMVFPFFGSLPLSILIMTVAGIGYVAIQAITNHVVQTDLRLKGIRHMAFGIYTVSSFGAQGLGNYWAALMIPFHSTSFPLIVFGGILILVAILTATWDWHRPRAWAGHGAA